MNKSVKLVLYVVLIAGVAGFGYQFYANYNRLMNDASEGSKSPALDAPALETKGETVATKGYAKVMIFGGAFCIALLGLGLIFGHDVSEHFGRGVLKHAYNDEGEGMSDPEYEIAEQEWADGHHLEAIRLMRDYLQRNPREQHVSIRIAEIYEKDLQNNLAAALEYEEVLKHKLSAERWGWAAIHLCNLYFKLNQTDKAIDLLRRIDTEYGETAAAEKARKRLALIDGSGDESLIEEAVPGDEKPSSGSV